MNLKVYHLKSSLLARNEKIKKMKIVSLILARGGSKGIPRKNIIDIHGKPLLAYTIQASLDSLVNETWVSTDCTEIYMVFASTCLVVHYLFSFSQTAPKQIH